MKLAEILTGPETWCQGTMTTRDGRACLVGALAKMLGYNPETDDIFGDGHPVFTEAMRLSNLRDDAEIARTTILGWNDAPGRAWDEIASLVDAYDRDRMLNP